MTSNTSPSTRTYYSVVARTMIYHQFGDRYECTAETSESRGEFDTIEEARACFAAVAEFAKSEGFQIIGYDFALPSVEFHDVDLYREVFELDEDGETGDWIEEECLDTFSSLPDEVDQARRNTETQYWDYLDYKDCEVHGRTLHDLMREYEGEDE